MEKKRKVAIPLFRVHIGPAGSKYEFFENKLSKAILNKLKDEVVE